MSAEHIAAWHPAELSFNFTDTHNNDFPPAASALSAADSATNAAATEPSFLSELRNPDIRTEVADALGADDRLSYHGMLQVLDHAAHHGMTAGKFHTLETLVSRMNAPDGISTSAYVKDISHNLIDGDPANAEWTGGESTPIALGNLTATSTQAHVDDLIGKWFLGTDLPSIGSEAPHATYQVHDAPLFAADGVPSYLDVNQGKLGDCWFVATLAEVALQDPSAVESMITNNGNGTYGVRFFVDGKADYVTVNDELPTESKSWAANGSHLAFANGADGEPSWAELVEKAFAQLNAEPDAVHGAELSEPVNSYDGIVDGHPRNALAEITDQDSITFGPGQLVSHAAEIGAAFGSGEEVELFLGKFPDGYHSDDLVDNHVFEVVGYDASTEEFTLHNPWGSASADPTTFTMSAQELQEAHCYMSVAQGSAAVEHAHAEMEASIASVAAASHGPLAHFLV
jgi:hypothetical protein